MTGMWIEPEAFSAEKEEEAEVRAECIRRERQLEFERLVREELIAPDEWDEWQDELAELDANFQRALP